MKPPSFTHCLLLPTLLIGASLTAELSAGETPRSLSGIYPHLANFNKEGECGTGAVVPWAGRLWVISYGPHKPMGSSDRLYELDPALTKTDRPESVGGTPANRMIHRESNQLFIGPYAIDAEARVRVIPPATMPGRLTGMARHLQDPANKVYYATMEEGLYEVDVHTLEPKCLILDGNNVDKRPKQGVASQLPGYHGKGLYSGQGRVIYANNGENSAAARAFPTTSSGALAEWSEPGQDWQLVRRNQFTEVTGPGGIYGNGHPATDPVWSVGWDAKSLILMVRQADNAGATGQRGPWSAFRLPKASHAYDGAHGWNTEWPRIRDIGESDLLMTMHGMFWHFPKTFTAQSSAGISPRSTYLKVIGDFCRWQDRLVMGCDDTAASEFLSKRNIKAKIAAPQSQSNLWFIEPAQLDRLGPVVGRGSVWLRENVASATPSDPFLFSGFSRRIVHLSHEGAAAVTVRIELDIKGNGMWTALQEVKLPANGYAWTDLSKAPAAAWVRLVSDQPLTQVSATFQYSQSDERPEKAAEIFAGIASADARVLTGGTVRALAGERRTLEFAAREATSNGTAELGVYELDGELKLRLITSPNALADHRTKTPLPANVISADAASVLIIDDKGKRWRLPRGSDSLDGPLGATRVAREVSTERDLLNAYGSFFELPADNAGGIAQVRAIATHNRQIIDYCSFRGLMIVSGIDANAPTTNPHIIRSEDGRTALWAGAIDDLWQFGKARGNGGTWKETPVQANQPSDPYLMTGYDTKQLSLSHNAPKPVTITVQIDIDSTGLWKTYQTFDVPAGQTLTHNFPAAFQATWLRTLASEPCTATAQLTYR